MKTLREKEIKLLVTSNFSFVFHHIEQISFTFTTPKIVASYLNSWKINLSSFFFVVYTMSKDEELFT